MLMIRDINSMFVQMSGIAVLIAICVIWYFTPKTFGGRINPEHVDHIDVFDGTTGIGFAIQDEENINNIETTLKAKPMKKDGISLFRMGYGFKISYVDVYGKEMCAPFIINSDNIIRQDPFFYSYYLLNSSKKTDIKNRFAAVIHKLMCYYRMDVLWGQWEEKAPPERIDMIIDEIIENSSGELNCLFPDIDMLLVFSWDSLNIDIYNPPEDVMELLDKIATSEGLFFRKGVNE